VVRVVSQNITISDDFYAFLADTARRRGVSIEELLRTWQAASHEDERTADEQMRARHDAVQHSIALYDQLAASHGVFPDSTDLVREDRAR
jgi:hypothetical protein